jgi:Na+/proline symporter
MGTHPRSRQRRRALATALAGFFVIAGVVDAGVGLFLLAMHDGYGWFHLALGGVVATLAGLVAPRRRDAASDNSVPVVNSRNSAIGLLTCSIFALVVGIGGAAAVIFGGHVEPTWIAAPAALLAVGVFGAWFSALSLRAHRRMAADRARIRPDAEG